MDYVVDYLDEIKKDYPKMKESCAQFERENAAFCRRIGLDMDAFNIEKHPDYPDEAIFLMPKLSERDQTVLGAYLRNREKMYILEKSVHSIADEGIRSIAEDYYLTGKKQPAIATEIGHTKSYVSKKLDKAECTAQYKAAEEMYRVVVAGNGTFSIHVANRNATTGAPEWTKCTTDDKKVVTWPEDTKEAPTEMLSFGEGEGAYTVNVYTALNVSPLSRKVILRKVILPEEEGDGYSPLPDAVFTVYYADKQTVVKLRDDAGNVVTFKDASDNDKTELTGLSSGNSGVFWIGKLPYGTYYLHETIIPTGYKDVTEGDTGNWFILTVSEDGVGYLQVEEAGSDKIVNKLEPEASKP